MIRNLAAFNRALLRSLTALVAGLTFSTLGLAQSLANDHQKNREYAEEASVLLGIFDDWAEAATDCDPDRLKSLYHDQISFWPSVAKKPFYGKEQTAAVFKRMCDLNPFLIVEPVERFVDLIGNTAVVFGSLRFRKPLNEQLVYVPARFSFTLIKEDNEWKILHMQSMTVPFDPTKSTDAATKSTGAAKKSANPNQ